MLRLQIGWESTNTPPMARRGELIRWEARTWLEAQLPVLDEAVGEEVDDLVVEGRDGTGPKSEIPWVRISSAQRSPSATKGWYLVYLFDAFGSRAYLSLNQGTTVWDGSSYVPRARADLADRAVRAREAVAELVSRHDLLSSIALPTRKSPLGRQYEAGNVLALTYPRGRVPPDGTLIEDLRFMTELLGEVYRYDQKVGMPGEPPPEVDDGILAAERSSGRRTRSGQGFRLDAAERQVIERRAEVVAMSHYRHDGWDVEDVSREPVSYDLRLTRADEHRHVEVKGTTSAGHQVMLTRSEVERQKEFHPLNALVIVRNIDLVPGDPPAAHGGELVEITPWDIQDDALDVVSYVYRTGLEEP